MSEKINSALTKLLSRLSKTLYARFQATENDQFPIDPALMPIDLAETGLRTLRRVA